MTAHVHLVSATLAIALAATVAVAQSRDEPLNTLKDVIAALRACWAPPPVDQSRPGMEITFESAGASDDERLAYRIAVAKMLKRCAPLPFTDALGNAIAGRPLTMRLIDNRKLKQAENIP